MQQPPHQSLASLFAATGSTPQLGRSRCRHREYHIADGHSGLRRRHPAGRIDCCAAAAVTQHAIVAAPSTRRCMLSAFAAGGPLSADAAATAAATIRGRKRLAGLRCASGLVLLQASVRGCTYTSTQCLRHCWTARRSRFVQSAAALPTAQAAEECNQLNALSGWKGLCMIIMRD